MSVYKVEYILTTNVGFNSSAEFVETSLVIEDCKVNSKEKLEALLVKKLIETSSESFLMKFFFNFVASIKIVNYQKISD